MAFVRRLSTLFAPLLLAWGLTCLPAMAADLPGRDGWTVGVIPIMPPAEIKRRWQPVLDQLRRDTGLDIRFRFLKDSTDFEQALARSEVDFAVMGPIQTWKLRHAYRPLLRGRIPLTGFVVVRQDSPLKQLAELQGRVLAVQVGDATSSTNLVQQDIREQRLDVRLQPLNTESSALRSVLLGKCDAAAINNYLLDLLPTNVRGQLRILHRSRELPPPAISVSVRTPVATVDKFRQGMLRLRETQPALLDAILMPDLMDADLTRDYEILQRLLPAEILNGAP